jgi:NDP-sugar pyrophosphorylase family protein
MKAMILAAGRGTRLRPLTEGLPKPLITVAGRPLIAYPLLQLRALGVRDVVVNLHHLAPSMRHALGDGSRFGVRIIYSEEPELLDTGGGVYRARAWLDETFLILNADTLHDVPLADVVDFHRQRGGIATLVLRRDAEAERYGLIEVDAAARVRRFRGQPRDCPQPLRPLMYAGVSVWEPRVFAHMTPGTFSLTRATIPRLLAAEEALYGYLYNGYWRVIDSPEDLERGRRELEGGQKVSYLTDEIS